MRTSAAALRVALVLLCLSLFSAMHLLALQASRIASRGGDRPFWSTRGQSGHHRAGGGWNHTTVQTGADGTYVFPQLAPGSYTITVTAPRALPSRSPRR
jgi:hypothetical protein